MSVKPQFLIILDFLYQKYEIEYEENMSVQAVIRKIQRYLFPSERNEDLISKSNEESCEKFCLFRNQLDNLKSTELVTWNITPEECDYKKYQFYLFRPLVNVYLKIYIVYPKEEEKHRSKAYLNIIYPIKKKVVFLKNYLKDKINEYIKGKEEFKDPIKGFILQSVSDGRVFTDNEYVEQWMNGKEVFLIVDPMYTINQNFGALGRFYYFSFDQSREILSNDTESLDYDETIGFTLSDAKKKLIEKHQNGKNFQDEKVLVLFNSTIQTDKFGRLDDLYSDNIFYQFVVIFESDIQITQIPQVYSSEPKRIYEIPIPKGGRPNIVKFEIAGEPKHENSLIRNMNQQNDTDNESNNDSSISNDNHVDHISQNFTENNDNSQNYKSDKNKEEKKSNEPNKMIIEKGEEDRDGSNDLTLPHRTNTRQENIFTETHSEENLLDMFCYYFNEFMKVKGTNTNLTPKPGYFRNLSEDEKILIHTLKKYYSLYRETKH